MPELPEVETTLRGIQPYVEDAIFVDLEVRNPALRWPVLTKDLQQLLGQTVLSCERRAKYILLHTEKGSAMLHLGMSGSLRVLSADEKDNLKKHDHIDLCFRRTSIDQEKESTGSSSENVWIVRFHDPRRFGSLLFLSKGEQQQHPLLSKLGPEPLTNEFNEDYLFKLSRKRQQAVKNFIMNGHIVVGVGNIYASEALFLAKVRPTRPAKKVTKREYQRLCQAIKMVLAKAIEVGGTTLRDFTSSDGQAGYFRQKLNVYDRDGKPCKSCGNEIKRVVIGQRSSFYCPSCQK